MEMKQWVEALFETSEKKPGVETHWDTEGRKHGTGRNGLMLLGRPALALSPQAAGRVSPKTRAFALAGKPSPLSNRDEHTHRTTGSARDLTSTVAFHRRGQGLGNGAKPLVWHQSPIPAHQDSR